MLVLVATATSSLSLPVLAFSSGVNRADFVIAAEPICKRAVKANVGLFRDIRTAKLKTVARRFTRASRDFRESVRELETVPQPTADEPLLTQWLQALLTESDLLAALGSSLIAEEKGRAYHYAERLHRNADYANNLVLDFGFAYCTMDPARFV